MTPNPPGGQAERRKFCPLHGERDQIGIYCNQPMGTRLNCGERLTDHPPGQAERERCGGTAEERGEPCCPDCGAYSDEPSGWTIMEGPLNGTHLDCDHPFHAQPTGPENTKEHIERMRDLTESVERRNAKIHGPPTGPEKGGGEVEIVKFFPNNPPEKGDIVLVNGNRCRVLKSEVRWDGRTWHLGHVKVESA